ncbi:MAG TPA: nitrous oxide reductase accessory protein NosL [Comamonas sp.]
MSCPADLTPNHTRRAWLVRVLPGVSLGAVSAAGLGWMLIPSSTVPSATLPGDDVCLVAPPTPYDPASGLPLTAPRSIPMDARCPVCGMFPYRAPAWAAQLIFAQGDAHFFDSPLSMFQFLQNIAHYSPGHSRSEVVAQYVSHSATTNGQEWLPAQDAIYVHGPQILGPMRTPNLQAFPSRATALAFAKPRAALMATYGEIDRSLIQRLGQHSRHGVSSPGHA